MEWFCPILKHNLWNVFCAYCRMSVILSKGLLWQKSLNRLVILFHPYYEQNMEVQMHFSSIDEPAKCCWNIGKVNNSTCGCLVDCGCLPWYCCDKQCWCYYPTSAECLCHTLVSPGPPPFGSSWVKRYSTFVKEQKILHMVTFDHRSGGKIVSSHVVT